MSDIYASLGVSPKKKRRVVSSDDETTLTPKKLRTVPPTPPKSHHKGCKPTVLSLPSNLSRLSTIQTALQHALSHALATCALSPSETGIVRNVLNHISIATYSGLTIKFDVDDLKRLCWIWEWDGKSSLDPKGMSKLTEENPFLDSPSTSPPPKDWTRGGMGLVISPTSHYCKTAGKRVSVYGIGIEVELDIDKDMAGGMAAVARWTAGADKRRTEFLSKLQQWVKLHSESTPIPDVPMADLPQPIPQTIKASSLTRTMASSSPKGASILKIMVPSSAASPPSSPSKPRRMLPATATHDEFVVPFPALKSPTKQTSPSKSSLLFPQTPSSRQKRADPLAGLLTPRTPARQRLISETDSLPTTPVSQRGANAETAPPTPNTSRRQALYERVRLKSLTGSPTKGKDVEVSGSKLTKDQIQRMGQEEIRRRCLLGRLGGVAESVWMLFSSPAGQASVPMTRKRRTLPSSEVAAAIIKSSPVPMSASEAAESLKLLTTLCPFFLRQLEIGGQEWFEMPPTGAYSEGIEGPSEGSPFSASGSKSVPPPSPGSRLFEATHITLSPGRKSHQNSADEVHTRSPRRIKQEAGGLREVREIIRSELELLC